MPFCAGDYFRVWVLQKWLVSVAAVSCQIVSEAQLSIMMPEPARILAGFDLETEQDTGNGYKAKNNT